jgi:hypothetical protein
MPDKKAAFLGIFRQLTPKHQVDLFTLVHLAVIAENSGKKPLSLETLAEIVLSLKTQEYSCEKSVKRRKK